MAQYEYVYPLDGRSGKSWHILWKIDKLVGLYPAMMSISSVIRVGFDQQPDSGQETTLNELMVRSDLFDATCTGFMSGTGTNIFVVRDAFMKRPQFDAWLVEIGIPGLDAMEYAVESDPIGNPGVYDRIEVHFNKILTPPEKNAVKNAYEALGDWKA